MRYADPEWLRGASHVKKWTTRRAARKPDGSLYGFRMASAMRSCFVPVRLVPLNSRRLRCRSSSRTRPTSFVAPIFAPRRSKANASGLLQIVHRQSLQLAKSNGATVQTLLITQRAGGLHQLQHHD
jgi:hypothetical protein